jgi:hypothetical protein
MTVPLDNFLPFVLPDVPGCPEALALSAIRESAIEFCQLTGYWQQDLATIDTVANQKSYTLVPPSEAVVARPRSVYYLGRKLHPLIELSAGLEDATAADPTWYLIVPIGEDWALRPYPTVDRSVTGAFTVKASLKPARNATKVGARVYVDYMEPVAAGAASRLLKMQAKPWFNANLALLKDAEFKAASASARDAADKGYTRASRSVQMRPFA